MREHCRFRGRWLKRSNENPSMHSRMFYYHQSISDILAKQASKCCFFIIRRSKICGFVHPRKRALVATFGLMETMKVVYFVWQSCIYTSLGFLTQKVPLRAISKLIDRLLNVQEHHVQNILIVCVLMTNVIKNLQYDQSHIQLVDIFKNVLSRLMLQQSENGIKISDYFRCQSFS